MDGNADAHPSTPSTLPRSTNRLRENDAATPPSRQQRLLRARNARFPAKKISLSGISARFSELIKTTDGKNPSARAAQRNQENSVHKKHQGYASASQSTSSLGILNEISNSIGGKTRPSQKRPAIPIFQDTPEKALLADSPWVSPSLYHDASSLVGSPFGFDHIQDSLPAMSLREISGNARKSSMSESSLYPDSSRSGHRRRSVQKSRFNSQEYIAHIEKELEMVKDAVYSPNTSRHWKEKLKAAKAENERLRAEIEDVKAAFEAEVQKTVEHMTATEVGLRRKIRSLEEEIEQKDVTIQEIETQHDDRRLDQGTVEALKNTIDRLEQEKQSLEQGNDSMSKRNEVLTQLLVISPTKTQPPFQLSSPVRPRRGPRPWSLMIPRMPSSPGGRINSRPQSVVASPALSATFSFSPNHVAEEVQLSYNDATVKLPRGAISVDSGLGESCSMPTDSRIGSRRSTIASQASMSPTSCGLPLPASVTHEAQPRQQSKRRARRFLPGSTQLKPLLLPTLTGENGALNMTSPVTSPQHKQNREFFEESMDPATMFLSQSPSQYETLPHPSNTAGAISLDQELKNRQSQSFESTFAPPDHPLDMPDSPTGHLSISEWSRQSISEQLERLEQLDLESPKSPNSDYINAWMSSPRLESTSEEAERTIMPTESANPIDGESALMPITHDPNDGGSNRHTSGLGTLMAGPSSVEVPQPLFSPSIGRGINQNISRRRRETQVIQGSRLSQATFSTCAGTIQGSRKRRKLSSSSLLLDSGEVLRMQTISQAKNFRLVPLQLSEPNPSRSQNDDTKTTSRSSSRSSSISIRSAHRCRSPLEILQQRNIARPLATVTIKTIYGTLSRYTTYIREIRRDPLALARRVLANAWHANWALMGKLSWWVLGVFLGPSQGNSQCFNWEDYDAQSIAERQVESQRLLTSTPATERHVHFEEQHDSYRTRGSKCAARPALKKKKLGWSQSLLLWGKFSIAIMMAVGGAVVKGPAEMLRDSDEGITCSPPKRIPRVRLPCQDDHDRFDSSSSPMPHTPESYGLDSETGDEVIEADGNIFRFRRKNSNSPPPSARSLLRHRYPAGIGQLPSPIAIDSPSPAPYQFGTGSNGVFSFDPPAGDTDWGEFEVGDTTKPSSPGPASLDSLFHSPSIGGGRGQEYDPESAPFAADLSIFSPLSRKSNGSGGMMAMQLEGDVVESENGS